jgi:predicted neuraminidase
MGFQPGLTGYVLCLGSEILRQDVQCPPSFLVSLPLVELVSAWLSLVCRLSRPFWIQTL